MRRLTTTLAFAIVVHQIDNLRRIIMATQAENQAAIDAARLWRCGHACPGNPGQLGPGADRRHHR